MLLKLLPPSLLAISDPSGTLARPLTTLTVASGRVERVTYQQLLERVNRVVEAVPPMRSYG